MCDREGRACDNRPSIEARASRGRKDHDRGPHRRCRLRGRTRLHNRESLSGVLSEEALGKPCYETVMGEGEGGQPFCAHGCSVMHLARAHQPVSSYEMRIRTRSGQKRWVSASNLTIETDEGFYLVHLFRDSQGTHDTLEMARGLIQLSSKREAPAPRRRDVPALTPRQLEVLKLLSEGKSAREIGSDLYLSQTTVRNHIRALLVALGAPLAA